MGMTIDEGRVSGARYYTVDPHIKADEPFWYHQDWHDMEIWCKATFGDTPKDGVWTPNARWYMNNSKFWFREKKDLEWFIIRWT
jgi:hypothetical protein